MPHKGTPSTVGGVTLTATATGYTAGRTNAQTETGGFALANYYTDFAAAANTGPSVSRPSSLGGFWIGSASNSITEQTSPNSQDSTVTMSFSTPSTSVTLTFWALNSNIDGIETIKNFALKDGATSVATSVVTFQDFSLTSVAGHPNGFYDWDGTTISGQDTFVADGVWTNGDRFGSCCGETFSITLTSATPFNSVTFLHDVIGVTSRVQGASGPPLTNGIVLQSVVLQTVPEPTGLILGALGMMGLILRRRRSVS